jgi:hypothetical protein
VVDSPDPRAAAEFWQHAAGWEPGPAGEGVTSLRSPSRTGPFLEFLADPGVKTGKNRIHLDVAPFAGGDQHAEASRLRQLGAVPADVGQGEVSWVVLADPQGNEFCVLSPRG